MGCPQCGNGEIDSTGICLNCGCQVSLDIPAMKFEPEDESTHNTDGSNEDRNSVETSDSSSCDDLPQWRKDLSQRFHEIKQKRERMGLTSAFRETPPSMSASKVDEDSDAAALRADLLERMKVRKASPKPQMPTPLQKKLQPLEPPVFQGKDSSVSPDPQKIRSLIDMVITRKSVASEKVEEAIDSPILMPKDVESDSDSAEDSEGKLILMSRTLSGLVDLMLVVLFTGIFIVTTDHFWGISAVDLVSIIHFSLLFLLIYFVYSVFFLASSNQTIGMMITELRVVGAEESRPLMRQIVGRCCCFLISLFGFGIGLLWSLFSRDNSCLHDRVSGTHVIRV
jgi:uncharacterized RDD family membrane protein YckC